MDLVFTIVDGFLLYKTVMGISKFFYRKDRVKREPEHRFAKHDWQGPAKPGYLFYNANGEMGDTTTAYNDVMAKDRKHSQMYPQDFELKMYMLNNAPKTVDSHQDPQFSGTIPTTAPPGATKFRIPCNSQLTDCTVQFYVPVDNKSRTLY